MPRILKTLVIFLLITSPAFAAGPNGDTALPRSTPEAQGISSEAIRAFVETADREIDAMNSFMLVRNGFVVAEGWWAPYAPETPHMLYSLSKSFTSTAVGFSVAEDRLSIDDPVLGFFPDQAPAEPGPNLRAMRVHDLLRMNTGHQTEPVNLGDSPSVESFLQHEVPFKPGTHFLYNTPATYMLSAIVQKVTGETVLDYLRPRLFEPLGIENPTWGESREGVTLGGYGLNIRTEDIAKLGLLYLQKGAWQGKQLLPAEWTVAATSLQTSNGSSPDSDWDQGYGYQFWRSRFGNYRGDGAFGQYCIVMPEHNAVVAITSGVRNMQAVMNLVWELLQPAMQDEPLALNPVAHNSLLDTLEELQVRPAAGDESSPLEAEVSGSTYVFPENGRGLDELSIEFDADAPVLTVRGRQGESRIVIGNGTWQAGQSLFVNGVGALLEPGPQAVAATGAWSAADTYTIKLVLPETPFYTTMNLRFEGDRVELASEYNVAFGPTTPADLVGEKVR